MTVGNRKALTIAFALVIVIGCQVASLGKANPHYIYGGTATPPEGAEPPIISISSPESNSAYASNSIFLRVNVSHSKDIVYLTDIQYVADWREGDTSVYHLNASTDDKTRANGIREFLFNETLTGIPEGAHSLNVTVSAVGGYVKMVNGLDYYYLFDISGSSSVCFTIDTTLPLVRISSLDIAVSVAFLSLVGIGLLVYFKKRKHVDAKQVK